MMSHGDKTRETTMNFLTHGRRPLPAFRLGLALLFGLAGCDESDPGELDGSLMVDGGSRVDGGRADGGPSPDGGGSDSGAVVFPELDVRAVGSAAEDIGRSAIGGRGGQLSGDGSCYVFQSGSTGVARTGDLGTQVYLLDLASDAIEIVSVDDAGNPADSRAELPTTLLGHYVSDDCRYVIFSSRDALSAEPGDDDSYTGPRVYLRDRMTATTELLSFLPGPSTSAGCDLGSLSGDGSRALFRCYIEGRNNSFTNPRELYLWSREAGAARYLDVKQVGGGDLTQPYDTSLAFLSANGRYVVSETAGDRLGLSSGRAWIRIDTADDSWSELALQDPGVADSLGSPWIATDGDATELLYVTTAQVLAGTDPIGAHLYVLDVESDTRTLVTGETPGMPTNQVDAGHVRLSRDGRYAVLEAGDLAFAGGDTDFTFDAAVRWDRETDEWTVLSRWLQGEPTFLGEPYQGLAPSIASDGTSAVFRCYAEAARNSPPTNWVELCRWQAP